MSDYITLPLELGERSYEIRIGAGLLGRLGPWVAGTTSAKTVAVVTNTTVAPLYLAPVRASLEAAGCAVLPIILPDGEEHKTWQVLNQIFDQLIENRCERGTALLALGGGVVGDMCGFAAASFLRGVHYVQVPTTLLAQVDSSVGGKTGINHPLGKNLIGAFYQPRLVVVDVATLATLPLRQLRSGLAEVIKYGIIWDAGLFARLEHECPQLLALERQPLMEVIRDCCAIKAQIVAADEQEHGVRSLLNLGHTFGHAIEAVTGYGPILHGEAVATGMDLALELSLRLGRCSQLDRTRGGALLRQAGYDLRVPEFPVAAYLDAMSRDKKVTSGRVRFVGVNAIGKASLWDDVPLATVADVIENGMRETG